MSRRRKRRLPFAAYAALIFNCALCAALIHGRASRVVCLWQSPTAFEGTPEALVATRLAMDERFQLISARDEAEPRQVWSGLVQKSLEDKGV